MMNTFDKLIFTALVGTICPVIPSVAMGQESAGLEEITVTGTRRSENIQDVALSITAFTGDNLAESGVFDTQQLQNIVPGLKISQNGSLMLPYIRGVGSSNVTAGLENSVALFVDGVYISRPFAAWYSMFDVERVEVLKGPQGTLFGRNATGGAIRVISKKPDFDGFAGEVDVSVGDYSQLGINAAVNIPISDKVAARITGQLSQRDGYFENQFLGIDLNDKDQNSVRAQLLMQPNGDLEILFSVSYADQDDTNGLNIVLDSRCQIPGSGITCGGIENGGTYPFTGGDNYDDSANRILREQWTANVTVNWDIGAVDFQSVTSYHGLDYSSDIEFDQTEVPIGWDHAVEEAWSFTQEFQLSSGDRGNSKIDWVAGTFVVIEQDILDLNIGLPLFGDLMVRRLGDVYTTSFSVFGELSYDLSDQWALTLGLRGSVDQRELEGSFPAGPLPGGFVVMQDFVNSGVPGLPADPGSSVNATNRFYDVSPKIAVEWSRDDVLVYGSATKGYKAGGYDTADGLGAEVLPASIWSYELGAKTEFRDGKIRMNGAIFYYDWRDSQVNSVSEIGFPAIANVDKATVKGMEFELLAQLNDSLLLSLAGVFTDGTLDEFDGRDAEQPGLTDFNGVDLPVAPDTSLNASLDYTVPAFQSVGDLVVHLDGSYISDVQYGPFDDPRTLADAYSTFNARLSFFSENGWSVAVFVNNLTDEVYWVNKQQAASLLGTFGYLGAPRTVGVTVGFEF